METFIGAAVGVLVNVAFPPAVQTRFAGRAVAKYAGEIASLLVDAATAMASGPVEPYDAQRWLEDARRLNRHAPQVDRALADADESRRLNMRAIGTPKVGRSLREGLEALEHSSVSVRTLFRSVLDGTEDQPDADYAEQVRLAAAALLSEMAAVVRTFGDLICDEIEEPGAPDETELTAALDALRHHRAQVEALLLDDPRSRMGLWEFNSVLLTVTDRMLAELDVVEHARLRTELGDAVEARLRAAAALERLRDTTVGRIAPARARRRDRSSAHRHRLVRHRGGARGQLDRTAVHQHRQASSAIAVDVEGDRRRGRPSRAAGRRATAAGSGSPASSRAATAGTTSARAPPGSRRTRTRAPATCRPRTRCACLRRCCPGCR